MLRNAQRFIHKPLANIYMRTVKLVWTFYRSFALVNFLVSLICVYTYLKYGEHGIRILSTLFWFKVFTLGVVFYYINQRKTYEYYYYRNLGITKSKLWTAILTLEIVLFISLLAVSTSTQ